MNKCLTFFLLGLLPIVAQAQSANTVTTTQQQEQSTHKKKKGSFYLSWGYNTEWYTHSDIKVKQSSLGNDYTMVNMVGHDHKGWDNGIFNKAISIPQYNYRLGYFFNEEKGWGIELNFDHTKFVAQEPQNAHVKGTLGNRKVDTTVNFQESNGFYYYLNNGANFFLVNLVKRMNILETKNEKFRLDFLGKVGIGPVVPHVENSFFGHANDPHFQVGGWNTGVEATIKATFFKIVYLEYCNKLDYARYSNLKIYEGTAKQAFGTYEMILNLGVMIPHNLWRK